MPGYKTHAILGELVLDQMPNEKVRGIIREYPGAWGIGLQGPDVFFVYPFVRHNGSLKSAGSKMHDYGTNDYFAVLLDMIIHADSPKQRDCAVSYLAGFICHYHCDAECHPYVYSRIDYSLKRKNQKHIMRHTRLEDNIDRLLMKKYKAKYGKKVSLTKYMPGRKERGLLANIVSTSFREMKWDMSPAAARVLIDLFHKVIVAKTVVPAPGMETGSVFNLDADEWANPWIRSKTSTSTFPELFDRARKDTIRSLGILEKCIEAEGEEKKKEFAAILLSTLGNRSYHGGYDVDVYEKELEEAERRAEELRKEQNIRHRKKKRRKHGKSVDVYE